uniref:Uncharacterized protein n=1 Tax=Anguilla anguilla TaxID=7936 RepID=A0A0E9SSI0_ANGAN
MPPEEFGGQKIHVLLIREFLKNYIPNLSLLLTMCLSNVCLISP